MTDELEILVCDSNLLEHRDELERLTQGVARCHWVEDPAAAEAREFLQRAEVFVGGRFSADMAAAALSLRLILVGGAGHDGIDKESLPDGVLVANTFNHESSIAQYVLATTVLMRRGILDQDRALREGRWASSVYDASMSQPRSLADAEIGIVGYGHIGQEVWRLFQVAGARGRAIKHTPVSDAPDGLEWVGTRQDLPRLLAESDVLVLCAPLDDETRGMIGADELSQLGPDSLLVNVGRGPLVVEAALYEALRSRRLGGAVLDTWYTYPAGDGLGFPATQPFWELPNVLLTPHISGVTRETFTGRVRDIAANIHHLANGRPLERVVHPQP